MNNLHKQKVISELHNSTYFSKRHLLALVNLYQPKSSMLESTKTIKFSAFKPDETQTEFKALAQVLGTHFFSHLNYTTTCD